MPNGILTHWQFAGLADLAERYGGGAIRTSPPAPICRSARSRPKNAIEVDRGAFWTSACARAARAPTTSATSPARPPPASIPQELLDTRAYARAWHYHILNERALYGLPRKFNVAFDGAGLIPVLEDTNDIGFQAVEVKDGFGVEPGVWFRLALGGITGHSGLRPRYRRHRQARPTRRKVADAIVRVFIDHGDRTDRNKARLKYVLDAWGFDKFLALVEEKLGRKLDRCRRRCPRAAPGDSTASAHIGVHPQKQPGRNWIGVVLPVGTHDRRPDARPRPASRRISATAISGSRFGRTC